MNNKSTNNIESIDQQIYKCLDLNNPKSFFLYAGAGAGKTRSLVEVLDKFRNEKLEQLCRNNQKIAVITYTNAACDEIKRRLNFDPGFMVSTIHSFSWELIKPHQSDIKLWLENFLKCEIVELEEMQNKGRAGSKAADDRPREIASKLERLTLLKKISKFIYNPNGDNSSKDSLNHTEVLDAAIFFLDNRPLMRAILTRKFPILFIDECQDTKKELIESFFSIQLEYSNSFILGLFGDTMQRIYADGKMDLDQCIPSTWEKPEKTINYRCPHRIIKLINKIRSPVDNYIQISTQDNTEGIIRLFIAKSDDMFDKNSFENSVFLEMAKITGDAQWNEHKDNVKILILEHHMAAKRDGFNTFFEPLYLVKKFKTGLRDGTLTGISLFAKQVLPLIKAIQCNNQLLISQLVHKYSHLLNKESLKNSIAPRNEIAKANDAVHELFKLWDNNGDPLLIDILMKIHQTNLFIVPDIFLLIIDNLNNSRNAIITDTYENDGDKAINAWEIALKSSFSQFEKYVNYISDQSRFGTHQGIKGLEFPRVMVILDDEEAGGHAFSYEKLFSVKELSPTDKKNEKEGKETSLDRTRRLFYVTCSRAMHSLSIIAYTKNPNCLKNYTLEQNWFEENEIIIL